MLTVGGRVDKMAREVYEKKRLARKWKIEDSVQIELLLSQKFYSEIHDMMLKEPFLYHMKGYMRIVKNQKIDYVIVLGFGE